MTELRVGTTKSNTVRHVQEGIGEIVDVRVQEREWPVCDPEARAKAFSEAMGEGVDEWWSQHAQWFIDADRNAAALCIYRFKTPKNLKRGPSVDINELRAVAAQ